MTPVFVRPSRAQARRPEKMSIDCPGKLDKTNLIGHKVAKAIKDEDTEQFSGEIVAPFFMCNRIHFGC